MGFFSSLWKGIKKVFKKIGSKIKKAVKGIGRFVGKLGIVGQIGMMFIMPHIGGFLMKGLGAAAKGLMGVAGKGLGGSLARGLGTVLNTAHKFATTAGNAFGTITDGVSNFAKTALNKIPGISIEGAATNFFGNDSAWSRTLDTGSRILDPFKGSTSFGADTSFADAANKTGIKESTLRELNPQITGDTITAGTTLRTDLSQTGFQMADASKNLEVFQPEFSVNQDFIDTSSQQFGGPDKIIPTQETFEFSPAQQATTPPEGGFETGYQYDSTTGERISGSTTFDTGMSDPQLGVQGTTPAPVPTASLLERAGSTIKRNLETDPLGVVQQIMNIGQQAQVMTAEDPDVFYGGGAQLQSLYEPTIGYQPQQAFATDMSQGPYGYSAFTQGYDFNQMSPYMYYMQQQQRYATA